MEVSQPFIAPFAWLNVAQLEDVILELGDRMRDQDLARLFENTFPNTLGEYFVTREQRGSDNIYADTTVKYYNKVGISLPVCFPGLMCCKDGKRCVYHHRGTLVPDTLGLDTHR